MQFKNRGATDSNNEAHQTSTARLPGNVIIVPSAQTRGQPVRIIRSSVNSNEFPNLTMPPPGYGAPLTLNVILKLNNIMYTYLVATNNYAKS